jgi:two-component SAPR family response regulator
MEKRNNRVINEIMANASSSIIVLSSSDCEYTSFLSELSNRYPTTYWYNAKFDNPFSFSLEVARKVFEDEDTIFKMLQFKYCENDKVDNIILKVVLDEIKKKQGDCLFVFDHLEELPDYFDFSLIELLIRNCPKNLKLIFISEKLINVNYSKLEEYVPKIVNEFALGDNESAKTINIDSKDLEPTDIHFLAYISQIEEVPLELATSIYPKGVTVLRYCSIKYKDLVVNKNQCCFKISRTFHKLVVEKSETLKDSPFNHNIEDLFYEYLTQKGKHINALKFGIDIGNLNYIRRSLLIISHDWGLIYQLLEMTKYKSNAMDKKYINMDYPDCFAYSALCDYGQGNYDDALKKIETLISWEYLEQEALKKCYFYKVKILNEMGEYEKAVDFIRDMFAEGYSCDSLKKYDCIVCCIPQLMHNAEQKIKVEQLKTCEKIIQSGVCSDSYLYLRMLQSMGEAFFDLGNYRKAIQIVQKIKSIAHFYVVPHKLLQYFYYMNDLSYAEKIALISLQKAKEYDITTDVASIYCLLAKVYSFWNMEKEATKNIEMAINCEDSCDFIKYNAISLRVIFNARFPKKEFPKDIAIIYAKLCEQTNTKHAVMLYGSIAFWYWKHHRKEEALFYTNKCLKGNSRNEMWLIASGVAINYALEDEINQDMKQIVTKFFYTAEQYAMDMVLVDFDDLSANIIKYATERNLITPYVEKIIKLIKNKSQKNDNSVKVKIQVMNTVLVQVNGEEIRWKTKKARELFMIYIFKGSQGIDRAKIFSLLWGEYIYESAINNLKTTNNIIRNTLSKYKIVYKLGYKNGKYSLSLANCEFDYVKYHKYIERFSAENILSEKITLMLDIIDMYGDGFAPELINAEFKEIRATLKNNICFMLAEFIKTLKEKGRLIDANKFQNALVRIDDQGKYRDMTRLD